MKIAEDAEILRAAAQQERLGNLEFEPCRLKIVNEMGRQGWRLLGTDDLQGLGPGGSLTFERETRTPDSGVPAP